MDASYVRRFARGTNFNPQATNSRMTSILIGVPFVVCFSMFGIFNLAGGTVLTVMACSSQLTPKAKAIIQRWLRGANIKTQAQINPMQVVGIILLLTGSFLVIIGLALGVIACRSVTEHDRRRNERLGMSFSGIPLFNMAERSSRQTLSLYSSSLASSRSRNGKKSIVSEKTITPIQEESGEEDSKNSPEDDSPVLIGECSQKPASKTERNTLVPADVSIQICEPVRETDSKIQSKQLDSKQTELLTIKVTSYD